MPISENAEILKEQEAAMPPTPLPRKSKLKPGSVVRCSTRHDAAEEVQLPVEAGANTVAVAEQINRLCRVMEHGRPMP